MGSNELIKAMQEREEEKKDKTRSPRRHEIVVAFSINRCFQIRSVGVSRGRLSRTFVSAKELTTRSGLLRDTRLAPSALKTNS